MENGIASKARFLAAALVVTGLSLAGRASATLIDRGGGLIYDDKLNITWLQDANYAKTSGFNADGLMFWPTATAWAANLSYFDSVRNVTWTDWRLPYASVKAPNGGAGPITTLTIGKACTGLPAGEVACRDDEMGYMFYYDLDGTFGSSEMGTQMGDGVTLNNIQQNYWSATVFKTDQTSWFFTFFQGQQSATTIFTGSLTAWAVRDGDVIATTTPTPEPASLLLFGLGALGMGWSRRGGQRRG